MAVSIVATMLLGHALEPYIGVVGVVGVFLVLLVLLAVLWAALKTADRRCS